MCHALVKQIATAITETAAAVYADNKGFKSSRNAAAAAVSSSEVFNGDSPGERPLEEVRERGGGSEAAFFPLLQLLTWTKKKKENQSWFYSRQSRCCRCSGRGRRGINCCDSTP